MFAAMIFLLAGCETGSVFDGSRVSDTSGFRMEYSILNREESADLTLPIYRGNGQQNADFVLEIAETGSYHIFVSGHQAKGNISFTRIPEKTE